MDSSDATYNAVESVFPNSMILMCYFHMKQNILKNCQSMFKTEEEFNILNDMIYDIHISKSKAEYEDRVKKFDKFYKNKSIYKQVHKYITKQWLESRFNKWQIFHSPPGYANTNSNIESFNKQIKLFTSKKKLSVFGMIDKVDEMVQYYSIHQTTFNEFPKYDNNINELAYKCDKGLFKKKDYKRYMYKTWTIDRIEKTCSCRMFCKQAICPHSLAFSHIKDLNWFGNSYTARSNEFVYKNKRGKKKGSRYKNATAALMIDDD